MMQQTCLHFSMRTPKTTCKKKIKNVPKMQKQFWKQYRMFLNIVSQFYRKNGKLTLFDNIQCTTKPTSHVPQKLH